MSSQLQEFFREKKQKSKPADVDFAAKRDGWIAAVADLYRVIEDEYLKTAKAEVSISRADKVVSENDVGDYHIEDLILTVGDEQVRFSPVGVNVIGAQGRIDVEGDRGEATIVLQLDRWGVVVSRAPTLRLIPLTEESLAEVLQNIMRP